ncbi:hypothetical protein QJS04_geneDACA011247 [Acorus gramineus]|uniref:DC1 domain-containing protein n=1 Tax=Acorus gramineus TaxID=55184 RepID=A0AAV9ALC1_ACOGR|nr:hypothetical protein QJS04_geneDACA011247 [Acorus gramineus]
MANHGDKEHERHPQHKLSWDASLNGGYSCADCKFVGLGPRYRCTKGCNFQVHECCVPPRPDSVAVSLFGDCRFKFLDFPPGAGVDHRFCDACGTDVEGCVYHCFHCDRDLHPSCACMKDDEVIGGVKYRLRDEGKKWECVECKMRLGLEGKRTWWYVSEEDGESRLHVHCARKLLLRDA